MSTRLFGRSEKWNDCFNHFLAQVATEATRYQYQRTIERFFAFIEEKYGERRTPDRITQADIENFLQAPSLVGRNKGQTLAAPTQNAYLMALRSFYAYAGGFEQKWHGRMVPILRKSPPTENVKFAKLGEVERDMTEEEVRNFFAVIDRTTLIGKRDYAFFWALLVTGRRRMEIGLLRRGDLEESLFQDENGHKHKGWRFWFRAKWRVSRESAEMNQSVISAIREFHCAAGRDFDTMPADQPLFPGLTGPHSHGEPMRLNYADKRFRKYAKAAGIPETCVLHSFRWENAYQRSLALNGDVIKVADELGWKDVRQAMHYIRRRRRKLRPDTTADAIAAKFG